MERPTKRLRTAMLDNREITSALERDRRYNDLRLKGTFENIFTKYAKDFTDVGDEIDLETGEIVVNNGHISRMRDEQDIGDRNAGRILRAFTEDMVKSFGDEDVNELEDVVGHLDDTIVNHSRAIEACESQVTSGNITNANVKGGPDIPRETHKSHKRTDTNSNVLNEEQPLPADAANGILGRKPDAAAFEALGQSIALQIARFMGEWREDTCNTDPQWSTPQLPIPAPDWRILPASRSVPLSRSQYSPPGSIWALSEPSTSFLPLHRSARRSPTGHSACSAIAETPRKDSHGVDDDYGDEISESNTDCVDASGEQILPNYLDRSHHTYSANTSAKRVGSGRKSRFTFSEADDNLLIQLKEEQQHPWAIICSNWPDIPPYTVQFHYHKHLKNRIRQVSEPINDVVEIEESQSHHSPSIIGEKSNTPKVSFSDLHNQHQEMSSTPKITRSPVKAGYILAMDKSDREPIGTSRISVTHRSAKLPKAPELAALAQASGVRENSISPENLDIAGTGSLSEIMESIEPSSLAGAQEPVSRGASPKHWKAKEANSFPEIVETVNSDQRTSRTTKFLSISEVTVSQAPTYRNQRAMGRKGANAKLKSGLFRQNARFPPETQHTPIKLLKKRKFQIDDSDSGDELAL